MSATRREFLLAGTGILSGARGVAAAEAQPWYARRSRLYFYDQYALNEEAAAFSKYDPDRIVRELVATGADIVVIYAANQFSIAYYPSKVWPQHPNLHGRDYVSDLLSRLRKNNKRVVTYINWLESRHPEWNTVPMGREDDPDLAEFPLVSWAEPQDPEKRVQNVKGGQWRYPCINSPRRGQVLEVAREIAERYHPDGFCLDMYHANGAVCVCRYCRSAVERICGTAKITREAIAKHWREYIDWKQERSASLVAELSAMLRRYGIVNAHNAGLPLHSSPVYGVGEAWMPHIDVYLSEIFGNLQVAGATVRLQRALGIPSWEVATSTWPHYAHLAIPKAWWEVIAAACKANGGQALGPCGVGAYPDTTTSPELLENIKTGFDAYMRDSDLTGSASSLAEIAVVFSWNTRKYFRGGSPHSQDEITGWTNLLVEEHLPYEFIVAERVRSAGDLNHYRLLILPNSVHLSRTFCEAVEEYVRSGGRVLAVGETSLGDDRGGSSSDFALRAVLGVSRKGEYEGSFAFETPSEPRPASGILQQVRPSGKVLARMIAVDSAGSVSGSRDPLPLAPTEWPVAVMTQSDKGRCVYIAFDVGRQYRRDGAAHLATFMASMVGTLLPVRQIYVSAPRSIEATMWKQQNPRRVIVHLANRTQSSSDLTNVTELLPVHGIEVRLPRPFPSPRVSVRGVRLESSSDRNGELTIRVGPLDSYGAVVIEA